MLNKEMLLNSAKKKVGHVKLTVGSYKNSKYGYAELNYGSLDRVPYWVVDGISIIYYLETLADFELPKLHSYISLNNENVEDMSYEAFSLNIRIVETDTTISCHFDSLQGPYTDTNNLFGFSQMVGQTVTLEFDPPPTAICNSSDHLFNGGGLNVREGNAFGYNHNKKSPFVCKTHAWRCSCQNRWNNNIYKKIQHVGRYCGIPCGNSEISSLYKLSTEQCCEHYISRKLRECYSKKIWNRQAYKLCYYSNRLLPRSSHCSIPGKLISCMGGSHA